MSTRRSRLTTGFRRFQAAQVLVRAGLAALALLVLGWALLFAQALLGLEPALAVAAVGFIVGGLLLVCMSPLGLDGLRMAFLSRLDLGQPLAALQVLQQRFTSFFFLTAHRPPRHFA